MSHRNHQVFPHPVLSPHRSDYGEQCHFEAQVPHSVLSHGGRNINITLRFNLTSESLLSLIEEGKATYMAVLECSRTYQRQSFPSRAADEVLVLDHGEWQDALLLTPYVASTEELPSFRSHEHSTLIQALAPQGISLPAGAILAVGNSIEIDLEEEEAVESIFDLAPDRSLVEGTFSTDLTGERIAINLHPDEREAIERIRRQPRLEPLLHQALYLHALEEALRGLDDHSERRWSQRLRQKLERMNIQVDGEDLAERSEFYAQKLLENPFARMLDALHQEDHDA